MFAANDIDSHTVAVSTGSVREERPQFRVSVAVGDRLLVQLPQFVCLILSM
jgi:hypothetical protein